MNDEEIEWIIPPQFAEWRGFTGFIPMLPAPDPEWSTITLEGLDDDASSLMLSSPNHDRFARYRDDFSLGIADADRLKPDPFAWDVPMNSLDDITISMIDSLTLRDLAAPVVRRRRRKAAAKPIVMRPFESCLTVELAVEELKRAFRLAQSS
jgi:hypothetical protein